MSEILAGGRYTVLRRIAQGGMGEVLLADFPGDPVLGVGAGLVVVKRILTTGDNRAHHAAMLREEGRLGVRLLHANVVETFFVDEHEGDPLLVMEYLSGRALSQVLGQAKKRKERIPLGVTLKVLRGAACGLHFAHTLRDQGKPLGLVHRDVSPANIFATFDGRVKVIDFGVAKADDSEIRTSTGILKGKLGYMSPEQALGSKLTPASDMWALGVLFWEMLCAERLFGNASPSVTLTAICDKPVPSPRMHRPDLPDHLEALCMHLLQRRFEDRICSGRDLVAAIDALPESADIDAEDIGAWLSGNFAGEAEVGRSEAARAARFVRKLPVAHGLVEGNAVAGPGDDDQPTVVWTDKMRTSMLQELEHAFAKVKDANAIVPVGHSRPSKSQPPPVVYDDSPEAKTMVADVVLSDAPEAASTSTPRSPQVRSEVSGGRVLIAPQVTRPLPHPRSLMPARLAAATSGASTSTPSSPQASASAGSDAAPARAAGPSSGSSDPQAVVLTTTVQVGGREASWFSIAGLTFGVLALAMGMAFALLAPNPKRVPLAAAPDPGGQHDIVFAVIDAPPDARLVDLDKAELKINGQARTVGRAELMPLLEKSGVWRRATLPSTPRAKLAMLLPLLIAALGSVSLAVSLPSIVDSKSRRRLVAQVVLLAVVAAAFAWVLNAGALSWPGLSAWRTPASLVLDGKSGL